MAEIKTKVTEASVSDFIYNFANTEQKIKDSFELVKLMEETTSYKAKMWGPSIIGFGSYQYKSDRSNQKGDWPIVGFSPRKAAISLYVFSGQEDHIPLLRNLGKYKMGKACIYINKLNDIDKDALIKLIQASLNYVNSKYLIN